MLGHWLDDYVCDVVDKDLFPRLRTAVKDKVFDKLKFLPHEGKTLAVQRKMETTYPSFNIPDLRKRSGAPYIILKAMGKYMPGNTVEDRVKFWKAYRKVVKNMILTERASKTQAMKECVVQGKFL